MATLSAVPTTAGTQPGPHITMTMNEGEKRHILEMHSVKDNPTIPLVSHIVTDADVGALQGAKIQPVNLTKVVQILTDPHSAMLYDRHIHALKKVIKHYHAGFVMKDLVSVFKILNVCADRIDDVPQYTKSMTDILQLCSNPFLKEKSSDEIAYEQIAVESIAQLGYLMRVPCVEIREQICDTLIKFYSKSSKAQLQKHQANTLEYNKKIIEQSDVSETLVKSLALLENDIDIRIKVLDVLQRLSKNSKSNCAQMLKADIAHRLCSRLMDYDKSQQLMFRSVDILWNLLEHGSVDEVSDQLNNSLCISQLQEAFIQQLTQGFSHFHQQLRNDLLVITSMVAKLNPQAPFVETGFVKNLTLFATFQEVKSHNAMVKHLKLLPNHEDFELKKLLINALVIMSDDPSVIPVLSDGKLMLALFSYVKANDTSSPQDWTVSQFEELQLLALSALAHLGPAMIEDYMMCQGSTRLLLLLEWCVGADDFRGSGNSFHGVGGRGSKRAQMRRCLRLIRSMVSTGEESVIQDLADQGAINQLTTILAISAKNFEIKAEDSLDIEMQYDMLFILSTLCENDNHRKEIFGTQGVDVLLKYLKRDPKLLTSGLGHHTLLLAAIDAVWCGVVGCYMTEDYYLEKHGVFLLLDMLETCPKNMHNLVLGCVLDLSENPKAISHIHAWRGGSDSTAGHLLCDIWRNEEQSMGTLRESNGTIADIKRPLIGRLQEEQGIVPLPASCPSQAIVDVSENMRSKIYALFCKLGFIELAGLMTDDHVTLTIIEHYLDFKLGEVWTEMASELEQEQVRPITPDREALEAISRTVEDRADHVLQVQKELLDAQQQQDLIDEQEHYAEIRENHRQKEKAIRNFSEYVARTSNYTLLKAAKERQELSIDASRVQNNYKALEAFHSTDLPSINTTALHVLEDLYCSPNIHGSDSVYNAESCQYCLTDSEDSLYDDEQVKNEVEATKICLTPEPKEPLKEPLPIIVEHLAPTMPKKLGSYASQLMYEGRIPNNLSEDEKRSIAQCSNRAIAPLSIASTASVRWLKQGSYLIGSKYVENSSLCSSEWISSTCMYDSWYTSYSEMLLPDSDVDSCEVNVHSWVKRLPCSVAVRKAQFGSPCNTSESGSEIESMTDSRSMELLASSLQRSSPMMHSVSRMSTNSGASSNSGSPSNYGSRLNSGFTSYTGSSSESYTVTDSSGSMKSFQSSSCGSE